MSEKELRLAAWCRGRGVDGIRLKRRTNIAWLSDGVNADLWNHPARPQ